MNNCFSVISKFESINFNILIVEDSSSMSKMINTIFSNLGFNTFLAPTLKDAREILTKHDINYILLDMNLPDGNGYELIEELSYLSVKIIVLTSLTDCQLKEASYQKGIIDFVNKDKNFIYKIAEIPNLIKLQAQTNTFFHRILDLAQKHRSNNLDNQSIKTSQFAGKFHFHIQANR